MGQCTEMATSKTPARKTAKGALKIGRGRPSSYTEAKAEDICERIASGISLRAICALPDMPDEKTVYAWMDRHDNFRARYARARTRQAEHYAQQIIDIADSAPETVKGVEKARLQIDARKWVAAKLLPKAYGERVQQDNISSDGSMTPRGPVQIVIEGG